MEHILTTLSKEGIVINLVFKHKLGWELTAYHAAYIDRKKSKPLFKIEGATSVTYCFFELGEWVEREGAK